jgi:hypothetical protein
LIFQEEGMSDAVSGLLVAAVTAAAVAGIFLWMARAKRRKIEALLSRFLGEEMAGFQVFSAGERLDSRFVLFAGEWPPAASLFSSWAEELLLGWPAALPLIVRSSPARLSLQVMNRRLEKPAEVAALIELGESFSSPYQNT